MKDNEIRGLLLQEYYRRRREPHFQPKPENFSGQLTVGEILSVSDQLAQHGLIDWKSIGTMRDPERGRGLGKITADGIDVVEGTSTAPIAINLSNVSVHGSPNANVVVGDGNTLNVNANIEGIIRAINEANASPEQKAEAKSLLKRLAEHPLIVAMVGGISSAFGG